MQPYKCRKFYYIKDDLSVDNNLRSTVSHLRSAALFSFELNATLKKHKYYIRDGDCSIIYILK